MFFLMLVFAIVPLGLGLAIQTLFGRNKLSCSMFIFMIFISIWQLDVGILFAHDYFGREMIDFLFRLFRFGSIMLSPSLLYVSYVIYNELVDRKKLSGRWRWFINRRMIIAFLIWSLIVYVLGWTTQGIIGLNLVQIQHSESFLFPVYGAYSWLFNVSFPLFFISFGICLAISRRVSNVHIKSFLLLFVLTSIVAYSIGILNISQRSGLYPSSIAVLIFAIAVFIGFCLMHANFVKEMNKALFDQKEFLRTVIDTNPNFIYTKNSDGELTLANLSLANLYGETIDNILGKRETDFVRYENDEHAGGNNVNDNLESFEGVHNVEERIIDAAGNRRWMQTAKVPIRILNSLQQLCVSTDITERKQYENKITELAYHDTLTGLLNRLSFNQSLSQALLAKHTHIVLMFIDLDRFKVINDTLGHSMGDQFLKLVAGRLTYHLEGRGEVFRIGGDEFVIMIQNSSHDEAVVYAEKIISSFKSPFYLAGQEIYSTPSIGISLSPYDGADAETLTKHADTAMHRAKEHGKNKYRFYNSDMDGAYLRKMVIEKELRKAVKNGELEVYYQPRIHLETRRMVGVEALARWKHPELGEISPVEFIPLAEDTGLIVPIGEWVLRQTCSQLKTWIDEGLMPVRMAVNISLRQFYEFNLVETITGIIAESNIDPGYLELEITESVAMYDSNQVIEKLIQLKQLGVSISMDDFGTGYSSLSHLKKLPIDKLKIDRSFLNDVTVDKDNAAIVSTIIAMARNMDLQVVAEGVENEEQLRFLENQKCNEAQGYYFNRPLPEEEIRRYL
ncbi:EAL domain-containing protein [Paenibacillus sp. sptzw28]|uniref:EAL domain-containing protein n=1 Tax=Paenibacillus sp. sptzw28 TaxID=715179 RepID=UPI001C6EE9B3|nr:EAL domain-containing protein [Paenibacillus sp. sptzw28]QYR23613.1 EAL domain-containing protein [Paenibacillus sp. sptzw28]